MGILPALAVSMLVLSNIANALPSATQPKVQDIVGDSASAINFGYIVLPVTTGGAALNRLAKKIQKRNRKYLLDDLRADELYNQVRLTDDPLATIRSFNVTVVDKDIIDTTTFGFLMDLFEDGFDDLLSPDQSFPGFEAFKSLVLQPTGNDTAMARN